VKIMTASKSSRFIRFSPHHLVAFLLLALGFGACTFGDDQVLTAEKGVAANFSDCVPRECFYACCQGPKAKLPPQLMGDEKPWEARCATLATTHNSYRQYVDNMGVDYNYCDNELKYEYGPCIPIPAADVLAIGKQGEAVNAGLHFLECPPGGDWIAYPIDDEEIDLTPAP
jgi:hypothetical protein